MSINPLLGRVKLPGRVFQLPSKGMFYAEGVFAPTVKEAEVEVKPMSALTELKIRSADLLYSQKILQEVCAECIPEILMPSKLISKDVDALFTFLVASTYGSVKNVRTIHNCADADWHDYEINIDSIINEPNNAILQHHDTMYSVDLEGDLKVKLKPILFEDSITLMNLRSELAHKEAKDLKIDSEEVERIVVTDLLASIDCVEIKFGTEIQRVTDKKHITEWIRTLPKTQLNKIIAGANSAGEWGFNFKQKLQCSDCGEHFIFDIELNPISFFTG